MNTGGTSAPWGALLAVILLLFPSMLLPLPAVAQDNTVRIIVDGDPRGSSVIGVFRLKGVLYASLTDLAATFRVVPYENHVAAKMEVKQGPYRIKVTGGSPFIVVTDQAGRQTVYQLPAKVLYAAGSFFVPLQSFLPYFGLVFNKTGSFEVTSNTLRVSPGPPPSAFDIPTVVLEPRSNGMLIRIRSYKKVEDVESWLRQDGWLYVTLTDVKADIKAINALRGEGVVKDIVGIQSPASVQLTFKLAGKIAATEILREEGSFDILIAVRTPAPDERIQGAVPQMQGPADAKDPAPVVQDRGTPAVAETRVEQAPKDTLAMRNDPAPVSSDEVGMARAGDAPAGRTPDPGVRGTSTPPLPDLADRRKRWDLDVIVIDPGHGGKDPGTIGVTGLKEKDVVLNVGLKLGALIKKHMPDVQVVYTRSTDVFIPLYRRGQIANEAGGKLFISIHCNSTPRKPSPTRGSEVYLLRPNRSDEAIAIAEQENAVIQLEEGYQERYQELTDENFILVTMAQSAYMRSSEVLAEKVDRELRKISGFRSRGVRQAGFFVLVGAAMPNILVETAFVSNREDEKFLRSKAGQTKLAEALFQGIRRYRAEYEKLLSNE